MVRKQGIRSRNGVNSRKQRGHTFPTNKKEEVQTESKVGLYTLQFCSLWHTYKKIPSAKGSKSPPNCHQLGTKYLNLWRTVLI